MTTDQRPDEAIDRLVDDATAVARQESGRAWREIRATVEEAGPGVALLAGAGACAVLAAASAWTATLRLMESVVPRRVAAALLFAGYAAGAGTLAAAGLRRLRAADAHPRRVAGEVGGGLSAALGHAADRARRG